MISYLLAHYFCDAKELTIVLDRTRWRDLNLFVVSLLWHQRAIPLYWQFLPHLGNSNLQQQQALLQSVLPLLQAHKVVLLGDREFCSIELGHWLASQDLLFCLRLRRNEYMRVSAQVSQPLSQLGLVPGMSLFFAGVNVTKRQGFAKFNVACKWRRNYRQKVTSEGWFLLTNLMSLTTATVAYQRRGGIEAMFRDCKSGGYSLEGCHACESRLSAIVLLISIAYTSAVLQGIDIKKLQVEHYVCRPQEHHRTQRRHSHFWVGLYGQTWLSTLDLCIDWVSQWMCLNRNKRLYHQRGLRAINLIQPVL